MKQTAFLSPWHKPGSPQWQNELRGGGGGKWCWDSKAGCDAQMRGLGVVLGVLLVVVVIGIILSSRSK